MSQWTITSVVVQVPVVIWRRAPAFDFAVDLHPCMTLGVVKGTSPCACASVGIANNANTIATIERLIPAFFPCVPTPGLSTAPRPFMTSS